MSETIPIQHVSHIRFICVKCGVGVHARRQLNDGVVTYEDCKCCHEEYRIYWVGNQDEIEVRLKEGKHE